MKRSVHKQRGAALIIALIMLVMLTLLAVTASRFTLLGTRASLSFQLKNTAFQAAEVGIARGLDSIETGAADIQLDAQLVDQPNISEQLSIGTDPKTDAFPSDISYTITRQPSELGEGNRLDVTQDSGQLYRYTVRSTGTVQGHNNRSVVEQGYVKRIMNYMN